MKIIKKLVITLVVIGVLLGGGLFALSKYASVERIKGIITTQVKEKTGRDLAFDDARLTFFPNLGVTLKNVSFSNADWATEKQMVTLGEMDVRLALRPLLQKRVEIAKFVLQAPDINLEISPKGEKNWNFAQTVKKAAQEEAAEQKTTTAALDFKLGDFEIKNGRLSFNDRQKKAQHTLEAVNITISFPDLQSALNIDGAFQYADKRVNLVLGVEKPMDVAEGKSSPGHLLVTTDVMNAKINGRFASTGQLLEQGQIEANVTSLSQLAAWLSGKPAEKLPFEKIAFTSKATASATKMELRGASLTLDDIKATGDVGLSIAGKPDIYARLNIGKIDLDRFMGADADKAGAAKASAQPQKDWDATPIDFSGLRAVDADVILKTEGFSVKGADVGASTLTATLKNGVLQASSSEASLFGGRFKSDIRIQVPYGSYQHAFNFVMKDVQAQPVLETFADFKKLTGTMDANISVKSAGNSQKAMVNNLSGDGAVTFKNGAVTGIDLVNIAQMIQNGLKDAGVGEGKTEFVDLGGTFTIKSGVAHNNDFKMRGPLVQATGTGNVDLPKKFVKYRVTPVLTASSGVDNAKGIVIPVDIAGPFTNIRVKPDYAAAVKGVLNDPSAIKEQGKALEQNFKQIKKDPGAAIENLLGGGGLFGKKAAPAPAPTPTPEPAADSTLAPAPETAPAEEVPAAEGDITP